MGQCLDASRSGAFRFLVETRLAASPAAYEEDGASPVSTGSFLVCQQNAQVTKIVSGGSGDDGIA